MRSEVEKALKVRGPSAFRKSNLALSGRIDKLFGALLELPSAIVRAKEILLSGKLCLKFWVIFIYLHSANGVGCHETSSGFSSLSVKG